jgi:hypothetical protein
MRPASSITDPELFNRDVHWLLNVADSALGSRSNHGTVVSILEHGGFPTGVPNTDLYSGQQIGWCPGDGDVERWRKLIGVWNRTARETRFWLTAHYAGMRNDLPDAVWARVSGALGDFAMAAMWVYEDKERVRLISACMDESRAGRSEIIASAVRKAEKKVREAHRGWARVADGPASEPPPSLDEKWLGLSSKLTDIRTRIAELEANGPECGPEDGAVDDELRAKLESYCDRLAKRRRA